MEVVCKLSAKKLEGYSNWYGENFYRTSTTMSGSHSKAAEHHHHMSQHHGNNCPCCHSSSGEKTTAASPKDHYCTMSSQISTYRSNSQQTASVAATDRSKTL